MKSPTPPRITVFCPNKIQAAPKRGSNTIFSMPGMMVCWPVWKDPPSAALYGISLPCGRFVNSRRWRSPAQPDWQTPPELRSARNVKVSFSFEVGAKLILKIEADTVIQRRVARRLVAKLYCTLPQPTCVPPVMLQPEGATSSFAKPNRVALIAG